MGKKWAVVISLAASAITFGACSGTQSHERSTGSVGTTAGTRSAPPHPTPTTLRVPTTTTSTPEYSFDDSVPPPKLINTGTDYVAILKSFDDYGYWLAAHHPDPALAAKILAPGSKIRDAFALDLTRLRAYSLRLVEERSGPSSRTILSSTSTAFSARAVEQVRVHKTVDATGRVTSARRYSGTTTYLILVVLVQGHWLMAADDEQTPVHVHL